MKLELIPRSWVLVLLAFGFILAANACRKCEKCGGDHVLLNETPIHAEEAEPFVPEEIAPIEGNLMHELHFAGGAHCGECHLSTQPMPIDRAHEICKECHPEQTVSKPIWDKHCLACHFFTQGAQAAAGDPRKLTADLCTKCHESEGPGGMLFAFCSPEHGTKTVCSRCHRPHESEQIDWASVCLECHPEHVGVTHPAGGKAQCSICHQPHRAPPSGHDICTRCHGQAQGLMVHDIPQHPENCLECHSAHFATFTYTGSCTQCHEGMNYNGQHGQPVEHLACDKCHNDGYSFKGNYACRSCHSRQVSDREDLPDQHKSCTTCHTAHIWRANATRTCERCHETSDSFEHVFMQHPKNCDACHDPHLKTPLPASGDCAGCHKNDSGFPTFSATAPEAHQVCVNCHDAEDAATGVYNYIGPRDSCLQCHREPAPEMTWQQVPEGHQFCSGCHTPHTWEVAVNGETCRLCHAPHVESIPNEMHLSCGICHSEDHAMEFVGQENSCAYCHSELPGAHEASGHTDCLLCHDQHSLAASIDSCTICHGDKAEGHYPGTCTDCHNFRE